MAELGFEVLGKGLGNWKILLSFKALKSLQSLSRSGGFGHVEERLRDLASGSWSFYFAGNKQQRSKLRVPLYFTRCNRQAVILWQVDFALDDASQTQTQLVKIWEIGTKVELQQTIDRVIVLQSSYSDKHCQNCQLKQLPDANKSYIPTAFPETAGPEESEPQDQALDIRTVDRDVLEMANRFYKLTEVMISSVLANDLMAEFPFDLSGEEARVIFHSGTSTLILGRSGTGKTTCLVFKLIARFAAGRTLAEERSPRQLLLTRSTELAKKLEIYIAKLMRTLAPESTDQGEQQGRQLPGRDTEDDDGLYDTIFDLQDHWFPLVRTFDQLLTLLESTVKKIEEEGFPVTDDENNEDPPEEDQLDEKQPSEREYPRRQLSSKNTVNRYVDFQAFKLEYWPRLPANLVKKIPIELAFAEIMGIIKGSISSRESLQPLLRKEYLELGSRVAPTFTLESERSWVYDLFEKYQDLKLRRQELDGIDRVTKVISVVRENQQLKTRLGTTFDEIYVDEVQDLRCLDIELLLSMANSGRALHLAGDTAQTISQDSHFRFQDIKALFYDHFAAVALATKQPELVRPQLFLLSRNYRSHQGILGLASLVMEMLWNGFPETVDKLDPEIGRVHGPIPVFFLNCSVQMFASSNLDSSEQPKQTLDFGAEQVILVRDQSAKAKLQEQFHDKALILTILQSKGMEFEDVFLWDFFTHTPCPSGWRCLDVLKTKSVQKFDSKKHAGMCSELKQFYVAITRTRLRLSIIESSETLATTVAEHLKQDESSPLVETKTSSDSDFLTELISLRSVSHDPKRWSERGEELMQRRQYGDAAICFRRANDEPREKRATAYKFEEQGWRLISTGNTKGAQECLRSAVQKFTELGMIAEATQILENRHFGDYEAAGRLWSEHGRPAKAAASFVKAGQFGMASDHYHQARDYDGAADTLRDGDLADKLVQYVTEHQQQLSSPCLQSHSRYCVLLLKQKKIRPSLFSLAIKLLGSPSAQEQAFVEYEMHDELAELYAREKKYKERFLLLTRIGKLGRAMNASTNLNASERQGLLVTLQRVTRYYFAGKIICPKLDDTRVSANLLSLNPEWKRAVQLITSEKRETILEQAKATDDKFIKTFVQLHALLNLGLVEIVAKLDDMPLDTLQGVSTMAETVSSDNEAMHSALILLTGIMEVDYETKPFILLPWSPLHEVAANVKATDYPRLANEWFLGKVGHLMLSLDLKLRDLWKLEWPVRCVYFLTRGTCNKDHKYPCLHKRVKASDCAEKLTALIRINVLSCSLTVVYRKNVMEQNFQGSFLGLKRFWLENLLRELTFVSSFEQYSKAITEAQALILSGRRGPKQNKGLFILEASIEELLFHRLGRDWREMNDLSSLFEQIQISQGLDYDLQERFANALWQKLSRAPNMRFQRNKLRALQGLETSMEAQDASAFQDSLSEFTFDLTLAHVAEFSSFHSITTAFEYFAAFLIFRSCRVALLVPQSWIDLHLPWFGHIEQAMPTKDVPNGDLCIYTVCLIRLVLCYCKLLSHMGLLQGTGFRLGRSSYQSRLLYRRSTELLALAIVNMKFSNEGASGFKAASDMVHQAFSLPYIKSPLHHNTIPELLEKLVKSYIDYNGKDRLIFVRKTNDKYAAESELRKLNLKATPLAELISQTQVSRNLSQALPSNQTEVQDSRLKAAVAKIWRFWRSRSPKLKKRRDFLKTPVGRLRARFLEVCKGTAASKIMRVLLTENGVDLHEKVRKVSDAAFELRDRAAKGSISLPQEHFEQIDEVIKKANGIALLLEKVASTISMDRLKQLAGGEWSRAKQLFEEGESVLEGLAGHLREATEMMDAVEATSTM